MASVASVIHRLRGLSSMATRALLAELAHEGALASGVAVAFESVGGVDAARRVAAGEDLDLVVLADDAIRRLAAEGAVLADLCVPLARSAMAVAMLEGEPRPDLRSEATLRQAVAAARAVGYSTGPSGSHLLALLDRWGLRESLGTRLVQAPPGVPVATLVRRGEVELGFQQLSELAGIEGVEVAGELPPGAEYVTTFTGAACSVSARRSAVADWLHWAASAATAEIKHRHGMTPA
jgi:molybdate transport system substrate-binding protein